MIRKVAILILILFTLGVLYGLLQHINSSLGAGNRLKEAQADVDKLKNENLKLKKEYEDIHKLTFLEKIARDKLLLSRPNETVVIISQKKIEDFIASQSAQTKEILPNWRGWLKLFGI